MHDIDILAPRPLVAQIAECLEADGYSVLEREWHEQHHYHLECQPPDHRPVNIEVHWHVTQPNHPLAFDIDMIWQNTEKCTYMGKPIQIMSPALLIVYLCWHSLHHQWKLGVKPLIDIDAIIAHSDVDWQTVVQLAQQADVAKHLALMLSFAHTWFDTPIPAGIVTQLYPQPLSPQLVDTAASYLLTNVPTGSESELSVEFAGLWQNGRPNWQILQRSLFLPRHQLGPMYDTDPDSWRVYACYPRHAFHLVRKHSHTAWRIFRGDRLLSAEIEFVENFLSQTSWLPQNEQ